MMGLGHAWGRAGFVAAPTGMVVLLAIGFGLIDSGERLEYEAMARGERVDHSVSPQTQMAGYAAAGGGVVVLLLGGAFAYRTFAADEDDELDAVATHAPRPPEGPGGIDIG